MELLIIIVIVLIIIFYFSIQKNRALSNENIADITAKELGFLDWNNFKTEILKFKEMANIPTLYNSFKEEADVIAKLIRLNSFDDMIWYISNNTNNVINEVNSVNEKSKKIEILADNVFNYYSIENNPIKIMEETIINAKKDLETGIKKEQLEEMLENGYITQEFYNETLQNILKLEMIANFNIDELKEIPDDNIKND